jgi:hypothetical protein
LDCFFFYYFSLSICPTFSIISFFIFIFLLFPSSLFFQELNGQKLDWCNVYNFGQRYFGGGDTIQGTMKPCGKFDCAPSGSSYTCFCNDAFVAAGGKDGYHTCVPS